MSGRLVPYVSKAPQNFDQTIEEALGLTMYLISEKGPTSLLFTDEEETIVKLQIGLEVTCSCSHTKNKQCKHTLFALLKKFKVDQKSPILWQGSYIDSEIDGLISGKYQKKNIGQEKRKFLISEKKKQSKTESKEDQSNRLLIEEDGTCPICQDELLETQPLTYCRKQCGNNFHVKCLKVWVTHNMSKQDKISCPMCRIDMGKNVLVEINKDEQQFKAKNQTHLNVQCKGCSKKPIIGNLFHCLSCSSYDICNHCFSSFNHMQHKYFLMKKQKNDSWQFAPQRDNADFNKYKDAIYKKKDPLELVNYMAFNNPLQGIDKQVEETQNMEQQLVNSLPTITDFCTTKKKINDLQVVGLDVNLISVAQQCVHCKKCNNQAQKMRRLQCGHSIDDYCAFQLFAQKNGFCPVDGQPILPGYNTAFNIKNKQQQLNKQIQVQNQLISDISQKSLIKSPVNSSMGFPEIGKENLIVLPKRESLKKINYNKQAITKSLKKPKISHDIQRIQTTQDFSIQGMGGFQSEIRSQQSVRVQNNSSRKRNNTVNRQQKQQQFQGLDIVGNNFQQQREINFKVQIRKRHQKPPMIRGNTKKIDQQVQENMEFNLMGGGIQIQGRGDGIGIRSQSLGRNIPNQQF